MEELLPLDATFAGRIARFFAPAPDRRALWPRWIFLRALAFIFLSAFYSLAFQIHGLIGPHGILPARDYLDDVADRYGPVGRAWLAPTLLWLGAGDSALTALVVIGGAASLALLLGIAPRAMIVVATACFLSFVAAGQDFADYQSDGMLLEAGFLSFFLAPRGLRPGLGEREPPSRASIFLLVWEWFRIYFESGWVKLASGDPQWRSLTAMDHYYENGPLPTWIGWYAQVLPSHAFHAATALATLVLELLLVWAVFLGRRGRLACFALVTPLQIGIILTANYAFLNYLVLSLGFLLLDDDVLARVGLRVPARDSLRVPARDAPLAPPKRWRIWASGAVLTWIFYATLAAWFAWPAPFGWPYAMVQRARIANAYGLFAVMTEARYEIEFQGTRDGVAWEPYPFRYKPQDPKEAPGIYAPYQPRFEWNLWFASLGSWRGNEWVVETEQRLMEQEPSVLALFARDPFAGAPPGAVRGVRAVLWQYWFTDRATKRRTGAWWRRERVGVYAPVLERRDDGTIGIARAPATSDAP